ncbi:MAG TPA: hypothetical protein VMU02_04490 [bacterium]|nr:hypothetical protein [bacterium]
MAIIYIGKNRGQIEKDVVRTSGSSNSTDMEFTYDTTKSLTRLDLMTFLEELEVFLLQSMVETISQ